MAQRYWIVTSVGIAAFVIVILAALGAYLLLGTPANKAAFASPGTSANTLPTSNQQSPNQNSSGSSGSTTTYPVNADQATSIALSSVPGATLIQQPRLVSFQGTVAYEVALNTGFVYIDAQTGQVIYNGANGTQSRPRGRFRGPSR